MNELPKHVLIVGCGYLGRRAASRWRQIGAKVSVITRSKRKADELRAMGIETLVGDLAAEQLPSLPAADTLLWSVGLDRSSAQSREAVWIDGLQFLLTQLPTSVRRFLYVSSTSVYGQAHGETVTESTVPQPVTESGRCCIRAEQMLQNAFADAGNPESLTRLRMAGLYGPDRLLRRVSDLQAGKSVPGQPDSYLNLIHIDDAVSSVVELSSLHNVPLLNVVNTGTLTRQQYYSELAKLVDLPAPEFDTASTKTRGGNKRVVSEVRASLPIRFQFDQVRLGLRDAFRRTETT
ncbi:MAG: NAD-dependent epimerase/dehydratase family protein [Fuerstiella sp.]|nr:NAD-dependent epimerase/dehydratase family protein [Fuerstiella sp.]